MRKISDSEKETLIFNVIRKLSENNFSKEIKIIERQDNLLKKYKRAQRYVREFKPLFEGINLYEEIENTKLNYDFDDLNKDELVSLIIKSDEEIEKKNIQNRETNIVDVRAIEMSDNLIGKAISFGIDSFDKGFIDSQNVDIVLVGFKGGLEVYYCNCIDKFIILG